MGNRQLTMNSTKSLGLQHFKNMTTETKKSIKNAIANLLFII